jgi:hypothetical protein
MMPFKWACWMGVADRDEQLQPLARRELVLVAVLGDRHAADEFHHEVRMAARGGAGVEHAGDVRMVHEGERLPLGLEAGDHVAGVHARLDDLEGHFAADRLLLLGDEDQAEAAFADLLHQPVRADRGADMFLNGLGDLGGRHRRRQLVERAARLAVGAKQVFDALSHGGVVAAGAFDERDPLGRVGDVERGEEDAFGVSGRFGHELNLSPRSKVQGPRSQSEIQNRKSKIQSSYHAMRQTPSKRLTHFLHKDGREAKPSVANLRSHAGSFGPRRAEASLPSLEAVVCDTSIARRHSMRAQRSLDRGCKEGPGLRTRAAEESGIHRARSTRHAAFDAVLARF